jgi:hypothetical protein
MNDNSETGPYNLLGKRLRALRDRANESLAQASEAVEIDVKELASYELGQACPSEDILGVLISHFSAQEDEAARLKELAGYDENKVVRMSNDIQPDMLSTTFSVDNRILFTDIVDVVVNNYGVVMSFLQSSSPNGQPQAVAKVGMSREHAKSVLQILQVTLNQTGRNSSYPNKYISPESSNSEDKPKS